MTCAYATLRRCTAPFAPAYYIQVEMEPNDQGAQNILEGCEMHALCTQVRDELSRMGTITGPYEQEPWQFHFAYKGLRPITRPMDEGRCRDQPVTLPEDCRFKLHANRSMFQSDLAPR